MDSNYLGNNKYHIAYYLFNPDSPAKPMDSNNKLMEIELVLDKDIFINFTYKEYPENLKMASIYMNQFFGMPPPPPPSLNKN